MRDQLSLGWPSEYLRQGVIKTAFRPRLGRQQVHRTNRLLKCHCLGTLVKTGPNFTAEAAVEEIERLRRPAKKVVWTSPTRQIYEFDLPVTVYPPREDTSLLAEALHRLGLPNGTSCLEIGCGSGAVSIHAATLGWRVVACDVNPFAVACTQHHASLYGQSLTVLEGGPGPELDGSSDQWGGDSHYDVVMWNLPYLPRPNIGDDVLGPMEESALIDSDDKGLFPRYVERLASGQLLKPKGVALAVVSSLLDGRQACTIAWRQGMAARVLGKQEFDDGESLVLVAMWHPYSGKEHIHESVVESTNAILLSNSSPAGVRCTADVQRQGRGRRGRGWESLDGALAASWVIDDGTHSLHKPVDQVHLGYYLSELFHSHGPERICLKWPNDLYVRASMSAPWKKCAGVLFEGTTRGNGQRTVLGIGVNIAGPSNSQFGGLDELSPLAKGDGLTAQLHAVVASMFEVLDRPNIPLTHPDLRALDEALIFGSVALGPIFYRGNGVEVSGLDEQGSLRVKTDSGAVILVDDPDQLEWSNI